jgi:uncharacterized membrane protein
MTWSTILAAFLASLVEAVEAFTIVLAVTLTQGWRPALYGSLVGLAVLTSVVLMLGPLLARFPIHILQFMIGALLLLFGLRWLRKSILRASGIIALHDERAAFERETTTLRDENAKLGADLNWIGALTAFKAVLIEGIEVVFIVIAIGAAGNAIWLASIGALVACAMVLLIGLAIHRPLSRVPENTLKFGVGVMLSAFGIFWTGEGLGIDWPGGDLAILGFVCIFLLTGLALVGVARSSSRAHVS